MSDESEEHAETNLLGELSELGNAIKPLLRRLPGATKAINRLTGGLAGAGTQALASRLYRYRTDNLVTEAQKVADATGLPAPVVFDKLVRQRRIDEFTMDALRRLGDNIDVEDQDATDAAESDNKKTTDRWFHTFYEEASAVDEEDVREAFVRILAGEIQAPGSFSVRTLRVMRAVSQSAARHFRRAASVSIQLTLDGKHIIDARIPAVGGQLGQNCLQGEGLSYDVLTDMTENGLLHTDYRSYHPYGPLELHSNAQSLLPPNVQIPFVHQSAMWMLMPKENPQQAKPVRVSGAKMTSCGVELLKIVDIEPLPDFTAKLVGHFSQSGYQMVRS